MKSNHNIQDQIDLTLQSLDNIQHVNVSPFFKDKTLQRMFSKKEEVASTWSWFTPQLQLVTFVCVLAINIYAINQVNDSKYNQSISSFATEFGLNTSSGTSIIKL